MKHFSLITPFLFALSFVLYTNYRVVRLASPDQFARLLIILWLMLGLLFYPVHRLVHNREWASLLLTIFVCGFYFSESFFKIIGSMILVVVIVWQGYFRVRGFSLRLSQFFFLLNGIAIFIIIFSLYLNIRSFARVPWPAYLESVKESKNYSVETSSVPALKPDIYYIVLDGYVRSDMLKKLYGYDNVGFITYLREMGFIVPDGVLANYPKTAVSIPSTLNMDYIDSFSPGLQDSYFWWLMAPFIDHSRVRSVLESQGYRTISLGTDWSMTDNPTTDIYLRPFPVMLTDFERYFLGDTPLGAIQPAIKSFASIPTFDTHRRIIIYSFESLTHIPEIPGPKFIFAHIAAPHPPFVFDQSGNPIDPPGNFNFNDGNDFYGSVGEYQKGYIDQVEFVNAQMQIVVDAILRKSRTPPLVIIQADHGSGLLTDFSSAENTCIKERFSPFSAYYLPGMDYGAVQSDMTPVNLFRIILNEYWGTQLPMLENKQYYYRDTVYIYRLVDVTAHVDRECIIP